MKKLNEKQGNVLFYITLVVMFLLGSIAFVKACENKQKVADTLSSATNTPTYTQFIPLEESNVMDMIYDPNTGEYIMEYINDSVNPEYNYYEALVDLHFIKVYTNEEIFYDIVNWYLCEECSDYIGSVAQEYEIAYNNKTKKFVIIHKNNEEE